MRSARPSRPAYTRLDAHRCCADARPVDDLDVRPDPTILGGERIVVPARVRTDPGEVRQPVELVLLAVKATQISHASAWLETLCDHNTTVCVLQNGVEQVELIQPHCTLSTVIPAVVWCPAETQPGGWVRLRGQPELTLPSAGGPVAAVLTDAGWKVSITDDFVTAAWHKLLTNAVSGLMVLTMRRSGMFRRDDVLRLSRVYLEECLGRVSQFRIAVRARRIEAAGRRRPRKVSAYLS